MRTLRPEKERKKEFLEALKKVGYASLVCRQLGIAYYTFKKWLEKDKKFKKEYERIDDEFHNTLGDVAEGNLAQLIKEKHFPAIQFYLVNKKGYKPISKVENTNNNIIAPKVILKPFKNDGK